MREVVDEIIIPHGRRPLMSSPPWNSFHQVDRWLCEYAPIVNNISFYIHCHLNTIFFAPQIFFPPSFYFIYIYLFIFNSPFSLSKKKQKKLNLLFHPFLSLLYLYLIFFYVKNSICSSRLLFFLFFFYRSIRITPS